MRFAGAAGKPFPSGKRPRDRSPGEALGGPLTGPAVHRGEVGGSPTSMNLPTEDEQVARLRFSTSHTRFSYNTM